MRKMMYLAVAAALIAGIGSSPVGAAEPGGTLQKIKNSGAIVIGYREDARPFSFVDESKKPAGYTIDLCERIVNAVKEELGVRELAVKYVALTSENRFDKVADGSVDLECGNSTQTLSRMKTVDFSNMSFITGASILVREGENIVGIGDLGGKSVAVVEDTTTKTELEAKLQSSLVEAKVVLFKDHGEAMQALLDKKVDAFAGDQIVLIGLAKSAADPSKLGLIRDLFSYEPYGIALRRNDSDFRLVANRTLAQLYRTGDITGIYNRWFGDWGGQPSPLLLAMFALNGIPE